MSRLVTKPTKWHVRTAKTLIRLGIRPVWSESSLSTWRKLRSLATRWAHSEYSDQIGRMPRLIWVFAAHTPFCWFCHEAAKMCLSQPLWKGYLPHMRIAKARATLRIRTVSTGPSVFAHTTETGEILEDKEAQPLLFWLAAHAHL